MRTTATLRQLTAAIRVLAVLTVVCGIAYPLLITAVAQVLSPGNANGSKVRVDGRTVGSSLLGQPFSGAEWFHPRPSAAGERGYDAQSSAPSNLGPESEELVRAIDGRRRAYARVNGVPLRAVPADAVTASGSGLDPHISLVNARLQVARIARARRMDPARVRSIVEQATQGRTLGVLGDPRVNVLALNVRLQALR